MIEQASSCEQNRIDEGVKERVSENSMSEWVRMRRVKMIGRMSECVSL
jgi:hypothetical protein